MKRTQAETLVTTDNYTFRIPDNADLSDDGQIIIIAERESSSSIGKPTTEKFFEAWISPDEFVKDALLPFADLVAEMFNGKVTGLRVKVIIETDYKASEE